MITRISVLIVNLNNLEYTKNCINDLLLQDIQFNLTIIDQNSSEEGTSEYLDDLFSKHSEGNFYGKINILGIYNTGYNKPLNYIWNEFVENSDTEFICLLNNDVRISPNFLSSSITVLDTNPNLGIVNHTTNSKEFQTWSNNLNYIIQETPYRQGWDLIFRKNVFLKIPEELTFFYGDDYLFSKLYENGYFGAYVLNSPIIHYERSTTTEKNGMRDSSIDYEQFEKIDLKYKNLNFNEELSKWKPEFNQITEDKYSKESYLTRDPDVEIWRPHLNTLILSDYKDLLYGTVADFGCNHGAVTIIASENNLTNKIIGVDINSGAIEIAKKLILKHNINNIEFIVSNLTNLIEIKDDYFDNAFSFHTLEHIHPNDYVSFFNEIKRTIKNGGHIIFSIPYENAYDDPTHMNYFNESSLSKLITDNGLEVIECYRDNRINFDCLNLVAKINKTEEIQLSILICSLLERSETFLNKLIKNINSQIINKPVEVLILTDNANRPVGTKRNDLLKLAKGKYVSFIDDDDRISNDYVDLILNEINEWNSDVIVFDAEISFNGHNHKLVKYGREYDYCEKPDAYYRHPNHLMVHKKENITEYFKDIKTGEDDEWALRMLPRIVTQSRINKILYYYDYNTSTKKYFE
jgi:SAM-dependent methyltransferase